MGSTNLNVGFVSDIVLPVRDHFCASIIALILFLFFSCSDFIVCGRDLLRGELSVCLDNCDNSFVCLRDGYNSNDCIFTAMVMVMMLMVMIAMMLVVKIVTSGLTIST